MSTIVAVLRFLAIVFGFEVLVILLLISGPSILAHNDLGESITKSYEASLRIAPGEGSSTGSPNEETFILRNQAANDQKITSVRIDLSTAVSPNIVFSAGDPFDTASTDALIAGSAEDRGNASYRYLDEHEDGYDILELNLEGLDPGEAFLFSANVTANYAGGTTAYVTNKLGGASALDLMGSTVTIRFEDGTELAGQTLPITENAGESKALLRGGALPPP